MSYSKQNFTNGQVLTADHLNNIEKGIVANENAIAEKQPVGKYLTEHQPLKTINGKSLVGSGNITIGGAETPSYAGKIVSILGDSISTFNGYNPDDERKPTYPGADVTAWNLTWWGYIIEKMQLTLGMNDSWSGSRVHNSNTEDIPAANVGPNVCMAGLKRIQNLSANGTPDIIFFFGGTNDGKFTPLGSFDEAADYTTVDLKVTTWTTFVDAYVAAIMRLQHYYPNAAIFTMTPMYTASWYTNGKLNQFCEQIKKISNYFGVTCIDMRKCGVKTTNLSKFMRDGLHPAKIGMQMMAEYVMSQVEPILADFVPVGATEPDIDDNTGTTTQKLGTPTLTISTTGLASWTAVTNASGYAYSLNGTNAVNTSERSLQLTEGQSIKVKAVGNGTTYTDSDYSAVKTYTTTPTEPDPGEEPDLDVELPTETVWYADFTSEQPNYSYNLVSQPGFAWRSTDTKAAITGVPINAVKLFATADGTFSLGRGAADGETCSESLGTITLSGAADVTSATAQIYKLPKTIVLNDGEYLIFGRGATTIGGTDGTADTASVGVKTSSDIALVRTGFRTNGMSSKDEGWSGTLGIGYVVD